MRLLTCALAVVPALAAAQDDLPKLGPNAVAITEDHAYLAEAPAPDYWAFSSFVKPQFTSSACSVAAVTAAVNGLAGLPAGASETVPTQVDLLERVGDAEWSEVSAEGGAGVTFAQLERFAGLAAEGLATVASWKPAAADEPTLAALRGALAAGEAGAGDVALAYYNQGVVTGDWDGPHVAVIGAYDAGRDRVLILEVDQDWYIPYWTPVPVLLDAMLKPTGAEHGVLEGETGGLVTLTRG